MAYGYNDHMRIGAIDAVRLPVLAGRWLNEILDGDLHQMGYIDDAFRAAASAPHAFVVQVGAYDGVYDDPLRKHVVESELEGLLIEPRAEPYSRLQALYEDNPRIRTRRVAIGLNAGEVCLRNFRASRGDSDFWDANATTDLAILHGQRLGHWLMARSIETEPATETVPCLPLVCVLRESGVDPQDITMLVSDTEGQDAEVVSQLLETGARPSLILLEHLRLTYMQNRTINRSLREEGYKLTFTYKDTLATRPGLVAT